MRASRRRPVPAIPIVMAVALLTLGSASGGVVEDEIALATGTSQSVSVTGYPSALRLCGTVSVTGIVPTSLTAALDVEGAEVYRIGAQPLIAAPVETGINTPSVTVCSPNWDVNHAGSTGVLHYGFKVVAAAGLANWVQHCDGVVYWNLPTFRLDGPEASAQSEPHEIGGCGVV